MGWSSGASLMSDVLDAVLPCVPQKDQMQVCLKLIDAFEQHDADTLDECCGQWVPFDRAIKRLHPDWESDNGDL